MCEDDKVEVLKKKIEESKRNYRNSIRWYIEITRYRNFLSRQEDWTSEYFSDIKQDAELAWKEAQLGVLEARTEIQELEFELIMEYTRNNE